MKRLLIHAVGLYATLTLLFYKQRKSPSIDAQKLKNSMSYFCKPSRVGLIISSFVGVDGNGGVDVVNAGLK